jgi:hypothetical protein
LSSLEIYLIKASGSRLSMAIGTISVTVSLLLAVKKYHANKIPSISGLGGEQISLAIQSSSSTGFRASGYASISTNDSYIGGVVRQHGNLSFSRVFDAGHQGKPRSPFSNSLPL